VHTFRTTEGWCSGNAFGFRCKCTHSALQRAGVAETHSGFAVSAHISHYRGLLQRKRISELSGPNFAKEMQMYGNTPHRKLPFLSKSLPLIIHQPISPTLDAIKFQMTNSRRRKANPYNTDLLNRRHMAYFPRNLFSDVDRLILKYTCSRQT